MNLWTKISKLTFVEEHFTPIKFRVVPHSRNTFRICWYRLKALSQYKTFTPNALQAYAAKIRLVYFLLFPTLAPNRPFAAICNVRRIFGLLEKNRLVGERTFARRNKSPAIVSATCFFRTTERSSRIDKKVKILRIVQSNAIGVRAIIFFSRGYI